MLKVTVPATEIYDESRNEFISCREQVLQLEHSLVSLSKWESKWRKPFLSKEEKTEEENIDYIRCMTLTQNVDENVYRCLTPEIVDQVREYIDEPMTATTISKDHAGPRNRDVITSELIYCWMIAENIPFECQKWHLNRLIMLINVCSIKNQPPKKMGREDEYSRNRALNAARRSQYHTKG